MIKKICFCIFFSVAFFSILPKGAKAQVIPENLTTYKSSMISDDQLRAYVEQAGKTGLTEGQMEDELRKRGLPEAELNIIRGRLKNFASTTSTFKSAQGALKAEEVEISGRQTVTATEKPAAATDPLPSTNIFGASLFANTNINYEPNVRIPTPTNYTLGPDDEIIIDVNGVNQTTQKSIVSAEGTIRFNYVGLIYVQGLTVEEAKKRIQGRLQKVYPALASGKSQLIVSLGAIRSIKITILGSAVKAGTYTISSLATLFNALSACGGPADNGSFRQIELIRNNKVIDKIDIYKFLLYGDQTQNVRLQDMDVIRIPMVKSQVVVTGSVKRGGVFEILPGEDLPTLINIFAGGFNRNAYTALIKVERITDKEKKLIDITKNEFDNFIPKDGDTYVVSKLLDRFENKVTINGSVFRPGSFAIEPGMTISDLINKADGYTEDAYKEKAVLYRINEDLTKEMLFINLNEIEKDPSKNLKLKKNDQLDVKDIFSFMDAYTVSISGGVRQPGVFTFIDTLTVKDLIFMSNGLREDAYRGRAIVTKTRFDGTSEIRSFSLDSLLTGKSENFKVEPKDAIYISTLAELGFKYQVSLLGEVKKPGNFDFSDSISFKNLVLLAGGFTEEASLVNIEIARRVKTVNPNDPRAKLSDLQTIVLDTMELSTGKIDFKIQPFDIITVKTNPFKKAQQNVTVSGHVLYPGSYTLLTRQERVSNLVKRAGGLLIEANIDGARLKRKKDIGTLDTEAIEKISRQAKDSTGLLTKSLEQSYDEIALDLNAALNNEGSDADPILLEGDELIISKKDAMVTVNGEVLHPLKISYENNKSVRYYIGAAGGYVSSANKNKVFIVYANGKAARTKKTLGLFRNYPSVKAGSQLFIPKYIEEEKVKKSPAEITAMITGIATFAYLTIFIVQSLK